MANYLGQLDDAGVQNLCTALTDGQICKESGLDCDFVSFHTGAQNGVCGDDNWVSAEDKKKAGVQALGVVSASDGMEEMPELMSSADFDKLVGDFLKNVHIAAQTQEYCLSRPSLALCA